MSQDYNEDFNDGRRRCKYCTCGAVTIEGNIKHKCEDCNGTGWEPVPGDSDEETTEVLP